MRKLFLLLLLSIYIFGFGQKLSDADSFFKDKKYKKAADIYEVLLKKTPHNPLLNYKYGASIFLLGKQEEALPFLQLASEKEIVEANEYLGAYYFSNYHFEEAYVAFEKCLLDENISDKDREHFTERMEKADMGRRMLTNVEDITIVDSVQVDKEGFFKKYKLNAEAGQILSAGDFYNQRTKTNLPGYLSERKDRFFYADTIQKQLDLFATYKLYEGWSTTQSLSEQINTSANESYPFMMDDGVTLYFASDRQSSLGGYDIFVSRYNQTSNSYLPPENIGMPFNSLDNDYLLAIDTRSNIAWFATDRNQPKNKVMIYIFIPNEEKKSVKEENMAYLYRLAALKSYKKQVRPAVDKTVKQTTPKQIETVKTDNAMQFSINDTLVYTSIKQFKSDEARALCLMSLDIELQLRGVSSLLAERRQEYKLIETDENRVSMASRILSLEATMQDLQKRKLIVDLQTRNAEIKKLENRIP